MTSFRIGRLAVPARCALLAVSAVLVVTGCVDNRRAAGPDPTQSALTAAAPQARRSIIVMVWDGLRPSAIDAQLTPNLFRLREQGVDFTDHHSTYPTITMVNAASLATGAFPGTTGFYGNRVWAPGIAGRTAAGEEAKFFKPIFTEDYAILEALDRHYAGHLFKVETLFEAAQRAGLRTVVVGKSGPAFAQDVHRGGAILEENHVWPLALAQRLQQAQEPLPKRTPLAYAAGEITLAADNGDPTVIAPGVTLKGDPSGDPTDASGSAAKLANRYLMRQFVTRLLPEQRPDLSVVWLRDPDATEHTYGPGTPNYRDALRAQDERLGELLSALHALGLEQSTDVLVMSDHGHSNVSGDLRWFPLRAIADGAPGPLDPAHGFSVSGEVRLAQLLRGAVPPFEAFDDKDCVLSPALGGVRGDAALAPVYPTRVDADGTRCAKPNARYSSATPALPEHLPLHKNPIVIASNGGTEYLYLPTHDAETLRRVVRFLQSRAEVAVILVSRRRYPDLPAGTLPMDALSLDSGDERAPDLIVNYAYDADAIVNGLPGTIYASMSGNRGSHGSMSPTDVHNTLVAFGPDFKHGYRDDLPSGNVDVAPTIAHLLALPFAADGRVLHEALAAAQSSGADAYSVEAFKLESEHAAVGLDVCLPTHVDCSERDTAKRSYSSRVVGKTLRRGDRSWRYVDHGEAVR